MCFGSTGGEFKDAGLKARRGGQAAATKSTAKRNGGASGATRQASTKTFSGMPVARSLAN